MHIEKGGEETMYAGLASSQAMCRRLFEEKGLMERHTTWLDEEFIAKVDNCGQLRTRHSSDLEAETTEKLVGVELVRRVIIECFSSLYWHKEILRELKTKIASLQ